MTDRIPKTNRMTMHEAVEKAIEEGYEGPAKIKGWMGPSLERDIPEILLDPSFWQCLGKSLGWGSECVEWSPYVIPGWYERMHRFVDHLAEGKTTESFFETL